MGEIEGLDHLLRREELLIPMAPAQAHQIVAQGGGQIAHGPVGVDPERPVALGELGAIGPMDERDMGHDRHGPAQRLIDMGLAGRVGQMVVAPDDMGDAHVVIVHHHGQHIGGVAVRAQQHEVVEVLVGEHDAALDLVVDDGLAGLGRLEADHGLEPARLGLRSLRVAQIAPAAIIAGREFQGAGLLAHLLQLLLGGVAAISHAPRQQLACDLAMALDARILIDRIPIPIEPEPAQAVDDGRNGALGGALPVGVLDSQQHLAAVAMGVEPVEQRRAPPANMQESRGGGSEAGHNRCGHQEAFVRSGAGGGSVARWGLGGNGRGGAGGDW